MYIDKLDKIYNKYRNTYHRKIKMKSVDINGSMYIDCNKVNSKKGPKFNFVIIQEYPKIKAFLKKAIFQIGLTKFLWFKQSKHCAVDMRSL